MADVLVDDFQIQEISKAYILKARISTPKIPHKIELSANLSRNATKMAQKWPKMTPNGPTWPKHEPKWPKIALE